MMTVLRTTALSALLLSSAVWAAEPASESATCGCKGAGDCTCPKKQCQCKKCGNGQAAPKTEMIEKLKGASETNRLPETARSEARGGVLL